VNHFVFKTLGQVKRLVVVVIGFTILAAGIAMIVLPGPAVVVIPVGLALLATEFIWAKTLLASAKDRFERMKNGNGSKNNPDIR
jgi:uncharacterized protein (TIGR02611 family)